LASVSTSFGAGIPPHFCHCCWHSPGVRASKGQDRQTVFRPFPFLLVSVSFSHESAHSHETPGRFPTVEIVEELSRPNSMLKNAESARTIACHTLLGSWARVSLRDTALPLVPRITCTVSSMILDSPNFLAIRATIFKPARLVRRCSENRLAGTIAFPS
jgi:hypothetical protein